MFLSLAFCDVDMCSLPFICFPWIQDHPNSISFLLPLKHFFQWIRDIEDWNGASCSFQHQCAISPKSLAHAKHISQVTIMMQPQRAARSSLAAMVTRTDLKERLTVKPSAKVGEAPFSNVSSSVIATFDWWTDHNFISFTTGTFLLMNKDIEIMHCVFFSTDMQSPPRCWPLQSKKDTLLLRPSY